LTAKKTKKGASGGEDEKEASPTFYIVNQLGDSNSSKPRLVSLYGDVEEDISLEVINTMHALHETAREDILEDPDDPESDIVETTYKPFKFQISTYGGSAMDMFAIYDTMRQIRETTEIHTLGLGKVMSAGVLLLAAGTKGKRQITKNCRVMIHSVAGGQYGPIHNLENEMEEIRWLQAHHTKAMVKETDMTERYLKKLLNRKVNVYLSAEEAVEYGIADEVV
jgi:ATP-dependent Clp endopeptidase proteolytic subunit ClpP